MRCGPVLGQIGFGKNLQRILVGLHRLIQQGSGLVSTGPLALVPKRQPEIVLRHGPFLGLIRFGVDLERAAIRLHRLVEQRSGLVSAGPLTLVPERISESDLRHRPVLGQSGLGAHFQRAAKRLHRLIEQRSGLVSTGPLALVLERHTETGLRHSPVLGQIRPGEDRERAAIRLHRLIEQRSSLVSRGSLSFGLERIPDAVLRHRCVPAISQRSFFARQRGQIVCGLSEQGQALVRGRHLALVHPCYRHRPKRLQPKLVKALVVSVFFVFRFHGGLGARQRLRGLVVLQIELIRARSLLAVVQELLQRGSLLVQERLLRRLQRLHLRFQRLFLRIFAADLLAVGVAGCIEKLRRILIVLQRQLRQRLLLGGGGLRRLLLDSLRPLLHLLIDLRGGESVGHGPLGDRCAQIRLLVLRRSSVLLQRRNLLLQSVHLHQRPVQHGLNLRRSQQCGRALRQHAHRDGCRQRGQLAVGRLIDHQVFGTVDLDVQSATLRHVLRNHQPGLALGVGHVARFGNAH